MITPEHLAMDARGKLVVGYSMPLISGAEVLLRYTERQFRESGVDTNDVLAMFADLHGTVAALHKAGVVIGDFNDLNVLVKGTEAYQIDADSMQFGPYHCRVYTERFIDPLLSGPKVKRPTLTYPYKPDSDWYSFVVMFVRCMLYAGPYDGIYRPKDKNKRIPHDARPLHRVTIFNPEVRYPKPALPIEVLPDDVLDYFHRVFEKDERGEFPLALLRGMRWTQCTNCGTQHGRVLCPECAGPAPAAVKEAIQVRGTVTARTTFSKRTGIILNATHEGGKLLWVWHDGKQFRREDDSVVAGGGLKPTMRLRMRGPVSYIGFKDMVMEFEDGSLKKRLPVDSYGNLPMYDTNSQSTFWISDGRLQRAGRFGEGEYIGDVLKNQTLFWVGEKFGFGFYIAGEMSVYFVFNATRPGLNDRVALPRLTGQLVDSTCVFEKDRCWFVVATQEASAIINRCYVIKSDGTVEAQATAQQGDGSWLSVIRGKCPIGKGLLAPTDDGIVKLEVEHGAIAVTKRFPDTEPFVGFGTHLFVGDGGVYAVKRREVTHLTIK